MELLNREFTAKSVALALGIEARTVSDWATRELFTGQKGGGIQGKNRSFSFFNLMEAAVAQEMIEQFHLAPSTAFPLVQGFAHAGSFVPNEGVLSPRIPSMPFHYCEGVTYLIVFDGSAHVRLSVAGEVNLWDFPPLHSHTTAYMILNLSEIFAKIMGRLSLDWREVQDEAYPDYL